jgi:hypothetical protein
MLLDEPNSQHQQIRGVLLVGRIDAVGDLDMHVCALGVRVMSKCNEPL